jgi:dTDP-4-amino-4,6-dideoxygalactose transaminase
MARPSLRVTPPSPASQGAAASPGTDRRLPIPLSAPHLTGEEVGAMARAVATNWIAPVGPDVDAFEEEFAAAVGSARALATTSGTSALHLGLRVLGVGPGDEVLVSTLTFCASVNPVLYLGAAPVFVDSERASWNMDPALLAAELDRRGRAGRLPAAVVVVHLYGQVADMTAILAACRRWGVPLLEDAAEAVGASHRGTDGAPAAAGTLGDAGVFSFDGSKMITTSMGGMLVSNRPELIDHARKLARQAREPVPHYEHLELGYNYRLSNLLAAFGRAQLPALTRRVAARRAVFEGYRQRLGHLPGVELQPEAPWGTHSRWLTCILLDPARAGADRETVRLELLEDGIESRQAWKPMHLQPVYRQVGARVLGGGVAEDIHERGLCLPSSSTLTPLELDRVCFSIRQTLGHE